MMTQPPLYSAFPTIHLIVWIIINFFRRLDFREFVRDLFAVYKTRIWMEQAVPDANFTPSETVAIALQTG